MIQVVYSYLKGLFLRTPSTLLDVTRRAPWAPINYISYFLLFAVTTLPLLFLLPDPKYRLLMFFLAPALHFLQTLISHWILYIPLYLHEPNRGAKQWQHIVPTVMVEDALLGALLGPVYFLLLLLVQISTTLLSHIILAQVALSLFSLFMIIRFYATWCRRLFSTNLWVAVLFYFEAQLIVIVPLGFLVYFLR